MMEVNNHTLRNLLTTEPGNARFRVSYEVKFLIFGDLEFRNLRIPKIQWASLLGLTGNKSKRRGIRLFWLAGTNRE